MREYGIIVLNGRVVIIFLAYKNVENTCKTQNKVAKKEYLYDVTYGNNASNKSIWNTGKPSTLSGYTTFPQGTKKE